MPKPCRTYDRLLDPGKNFQIKARLQGFRRKLLPPAFMDDLDRPPRLLSKIFIREQAEKAHPSRRSHIQKAEGDLPSPEELFAIAVPKKITFMPSAARWEIARRMGGFTRVEVKNSTGMDPANQSQWVAYPGLSPKDRNGYFVSDDLLMKLCVAVEITPEWAINSSMVKAPIWMKPWINWDRNARANGSIEETLNGRDYDAILEDWPSNHP